MTLALCRNIYIQLPLRWSLFLPGPAKGIGDKVRLGAEIGGLMYVEILNNKPLCCDDMIVSICRHIGGPQYNIDPQML